MRLKPMLRLGLRAPLVARNYYYYYYYCYYYCYYCYYYGAVYFQVQVGVLNCQQILTKLSFVIFCAEMLQQCSPMPKGY